MISKLNEELLRLILSWVPDEERFGTVSLVNREFALNVWKPDYNQTLILDFTATRRNKCVYIEMLRVRGSEILFKTVWSKIKRIEICFFQEDQLSLISSLPTTIEEIRLVSPTREFVYQLFSTDVFANLKKLILEEIRCESIESIFNKSPFEKFPSMNEFVLNEIFLVKLNNSSKVHFPPSPSDSVFRTEKIELYLIPFTEVVEFVGDFFGASFPVLKILKFKCLSSVGDANLLAAALKQQIDSLPALEEFEAGVLTVSLLEFLEITSWSSLRKLTIPSRLAVSGDKLVGFLTECPYFNELTIRVGSSNQVDDLSDALAELNLEHLEIQWNTLNGISVQSLVKLRNALASFGTFNVSVRSLTADRSESKESLSTDFEIFFSEICQNRIVCECNECEDQPSEEHVLELARDEWDQLDDQSRRVFSRISGY